MTTVRRKVLRVEESTVFPSRPWWAVLECGHRVAIREKEAKTARCRRCEAREAFGVKTVDGLEDDRGR